MAIKTFKVANVKYTGSAGTAIGELDSATLTIVQDVGESTALSDSWKEFTSLGKSWTLTVSCKYNPDDTGQAAMRTEWVSGDSVVTSLCMFEDASHYFIGDSVLTNFAVGATVNGIDTLSLTFQGSGSLTYA